MAYEDADGQVLERIKSILLIVNGVPPLMGCP